MTEKKAPVTKPYTVVSAFVWDKKIRKPSDKTPLQLTSAEAAPLIQRGKITLEKETSESEGDDKSSEGTKKAAAKT
ncbi:hypothetical protein [Pseudophaeobacter sp.]|uniref:hypothetical protein n=1 Tax=Pseudophaeobacter sp. TaxID=1971739 RepID=UPI0032D91B5B